MTTKYKDEPCSKCGSCRSVVNGLWLRQQRKRAGVSLRNMAKRIGFSAPYISDVELCRRNALPAIVKFYEEL